MKRRRIGAILATVAASLAVGVLGAPAVQADPVKTCTEADAPSNNWETTGSQKGSCNSSHDRTDETVTNPGGSEPPGRQP